MRRAILMAAVVGLLAARADAQPAEVPTLQELSTQASNLDAALHKTKEPAARKRLTEELEKVRHQMGPYSPGGKRLKCQAMWHDAALEALEVEVKRLTLRPPGPAAQSPIANDARLQVRRMAAACLTHGWRIYTGRVKYQVDVFGQYLANNARVLDDLFDAIAAAEVRAARPAVDADERSAIQAVLEKVKEGVAQMTTAADTMTAAPSSPPDPLVPPLGEFLRGLLAVRDAEQALSARVGKEPAPAAPPAEGEGTAPPPAAEPPPMTAKEKDTVARVKALAAELKGEAWAPIAAYLGRFASAVEAGFTVASARPKARELLDAIRRAADLARSLNASKAVTDVYLEHRQAQILAALELMQSPVDRAAGYSRLDLAWQEDGLRRQIEATGLTSAAARGLVQAYYVKVPDLVKTATALSVAQAQQIEDGCEGIAGTFEKMRKWPPADTAAKLRDCYTRLETLFRDEAEQAGILLPTDITTGIARLLSAAARGDDMDLVLRSDTAVKAVNRYRPQRATAMYGQITKAAQDLVLQASAPAQARATLGSLVRPFEALDQFPMPEADVRRAASSLVGRVFPAATAMLSQDLGAGIDEASKGDPSLLRQALRADGLFRLLRRRAAAETHRLDHAGVVNLVAFSFPDKVWRPFAEKLDQNLRLMFTDYAKNGCRVTWLTAPADWDGVLAAVTAGQRQTLEARSEGETDLDFLLRNLERVAVASPVAETWYGWAVGYHAIEAAVTLNAGLDSVAQWHHGLGSSYDTYLRRVDLAPPAAAATPAKPSGS